MMVSIRDAKTSVKMDITMIIIISVLKYVRNAIRIARHVIIKIFA
jgi:hypothetical protein